MKPVMAIALIVIQELYRRKDFYVLFVLTAVITLLTGSLSVFGGKVDATMVRYVKEVALLLIWVSSLVIAIGLTARQLPSEKENRTIFTLLAKPVTRAQVVAGKFMGCWLAAGIALVVFYTFFGVISASREHALPLLSYLQALGSHWVMLAIVIALALLGSLVFAAPSSNGTICFVIVGGILLLGRHLNTVALQQGEPVRSILYALYFAIPHLELFDVRQLIIHDWGTIRWSMWALSLGYGALYTLLFLVATWVRFRRVSLN